MKAKRQKHSGAFKAKVAIEALQERETLSEFEKKHEMLRIRLHVGRKTIQNTMMVQFIVKGKMRGKFCPFFIAHLFSYIYSYEFKR